MDTLTTTRDDINYHRSIRQDNDVNGTSTDTNTAIERGNDKIAYFLRDFMEKLCVKENSVFSVPNTIVTAIQGVTSEFITNR
ncbi:MAG: hypothetical protein WAJ93_16680 [Candidatus Nitrosopolaris sp.]